jgi:hypothetical protein
MSKVLLCGQEIGGHNNKENLASAMPYRQAIAYLPLYDLSVDYL